VSIFDPTAGNVGVVAQLAAMTKLGKARTKFELFGDERINAGLFLCISGDRLVYKK
jgi:hypothetical protein